MAHIATAHITMVAVNLFANISHEIKERRTEMSDLIMDRANSLERYLTVAECSRMTGISIYAIRSLIKDGKIDAYLQGNKYMINSSSLEQFLFGATSKKGE